MVQLHVIKLQRDGGWSWVVLVGVVCSQTILGGVCLSGGIFYVIFTDAYGSDPVKVSILCGLPVTLWFLSSPIGSCVTNRYGYRACAFIGGIMAAAGLALSFFATSLTFLFFSHGILTGLGFGINYTGCMASLNVYFDKYKTIATGISSIGHNLGIIIYAELIILLDQNYGWRGMVLILSAITFNLCACASIMTPLSIYRNHEIDSNHNSTPSHVKNAIKGNALPNIKKKAIDTTVFRKLSFICFCVSNVFNNVGQGIYILFLPSFSKDAGFTLTDFSTLLIAYSVCNIVGKAFFSVLGHHPKVNCTVLYTVALVIAGVAMGLTPVLLSKSGMFILAGLVGFFYCVVGALLHAVIHSIVGFDRFADGVGFSLPFKAAGNLIGGPLAGMMLASTGSFTSSFYTAGASMVLSALLMVYPIVHHQHRQKTHRNTDIYTVCEVNVETCTRGDSDSNLDLFVHENNEITQKIKASTESFGSDCMLSTCELTETRMTETDSLLCKESIDAVKETEEIEQLTQT